MPPKVVTATGSGDRIISIDKNNFGPRIGLAYSLNAEKTMVLRGGYGLLYALDGTDYPPGIRNPPYTNTIHFSQFNVLSNRLTREDLLQREHRTALGNYANRSE